MSKLLLSTLALLIVNLAYANPLLETRYVTEIKRDANGNIVRRADVIAAFKRTHACPSTGKTAGRCDWEIDHVVPLSEFGADTVSNLQWMPPAIKSCAGKLCKDRWERRVYSNPVIVTPLPTQ